MTAVVFLSFDENGRHAMGKECRNEFLLRNEVVLEEIRIKLFSVTHYGMPGRSLGRERELKNKNKQSTMHAGKEYTAYLTLY